MAETSKPTDSLTTFLSTWLTSQTPKDAPTNVTILTERDGQRSIAKSALRATLLDHVVGAEIIKEIGGFAKAAKIIQNALPTSKIARSGEFGEILATEYVNQVTDYSVPLRRLRYKDDRQMAMRGDDVIGFVFGETPPRILKTEAKSAVHLTTSVLSKADEGLRRFQGRPNPSTLSFLSRRLRETKQPHLARVIEKLQETDIPIKSISHLIFTVSANNPCEVLTAHCKSTVKAIRRLLAGCVISDHASFIEQLYEAALKGGVADGDT